jgi:DNA-binding transcriptional ArsR family regulator
MPNVPEVPDYPLAETLEVTTHAQMKAVAEPTRTAIVALLLERAATTTELAQALGKPKGTVDHHLKVLADAGLVHVVRTRKVRAMTERYWGRTARTFAFTASSSEVPTALWFVRDALAEMERTLHLSEQCDADTFSTLRHARIPAARAAEFVERLNDLALEFVGTERGGDVAYGLLLALYPSDLPTLARP